ncbi:hypothetical protein WJX81_001791 [Elliptochloris bilobata]|uniref:Uncharacterized protein n=1 Tax=Elliptochloris bilobata TaxID=381761 RepID=A0AAW1QNG3_9CHLO
MRARRLALAGAACSDVGVWTWESATAGNWSEERGAAEASAAAASRPRFVGESASHAAHGPQGKFGPGIACHRHDWDREEAPSALAGDASQSCYTTLYQLSFGEAQGRRVQELLWSGRKAVDHRVPRQTVHHALVERRQAAWRAEAARSPWETTAHEAAELAVLAGEGALAADMGAAKGGPCTKHFDKTWLRIGLRG